MNHLTFEQERKKERKEATIYNALLAKGLIDPENQQPIDEAIDSVFTV